MTSTTMLDMSQLPYPRIGRPAVELELQADLLVGQWIVPAGTKIAIKQSKNFGWVFLRDGTQDKRGFTIPQRIFKY